MAKAADVRAVSGTSALSGAIHSGAHPTGQVPLAGGRGPAVLAAFSERIGSERFSVWFGDAAEIEVTGGSDPGGRVPGGGRSAGPVDVCVRVGTGFTHEWLRRTFQAQLVAAARSVCGAAVEVTWEPARSPVGGGGVSPASPASLVAPVSSVSEGPAAVSVPPVVLPVPIADPSVQPVVLTVRPAAPLRAGRPAAPVRAGRPAAALEEFVVGPSNRMALAAVERVVARPGEMSPLVVHGPSGVGKTHLIEAACSRARQLHPGLAVVCLSAEQFTTGFLQGLHGGGLPGFRRSCRSADLLVVDDIQFLAGKRATTLEFQHTVDALHRQGRQMIFACDRELDALTGLGADVLTRLRGGMVARIEPPDYEVRRGIVAQLGRRRGLEVPDDVLHHVATHITRHARELYGAMNRLEATSLMLGVPVTLGMAEEALADLVRSSARSVRLPDIERAICQAFGLETGSLQSSRRARSASHPRMLAMFLARKHTHAALADIGRYFGRRSHSTVIAAQKAVGEWLARRSPIVLADAEWDVEEAIRRVEELLRAN
jgi:chromosomal replication initiator protein